jgi:predicted RNA binding protein YcfA (HicA-like mRNA interferase family)
MENISMTRTKLLKTLMANGYQIVRQNSHIIMEHKETNQRLILPNHNKQSYSVIKQLEKTTNLKLV